MDTNEEACEDVAEGQDVAERLMAVFGFGDDQSGQEGAQGQGKSRHIGQPGHGQTNGDHAEQEQFPAFGAGDVVERIRDDPFRTDDHQHNDGNDLRQKKQQRLHGPALSLSGQQWNEQHHRNDDDVLKDQDAERRVALRGFDLGAVLEYFHDDGGAAQGNQKADQHRFPDVQAERSRYAKGGGDRNDHLKRAADEDGSPDLQQAAEGKFQADRKKQQHDAHFGQDFDRLNITDKTEPEGAADQSGEEKSHDNGNPHQVAQIQDKGRKTNDNEDIIQQGHNGNLPSEKKHVEKNH